jgi:tetratricopeptide (TPR) repeat protein
LEIPATLQDSLTARLDRLGAAREVAQRAAVIGREFSYGLVAATAGFDADELQAGLDRLVEAGLLFARGAPPHATYTFKHALIQEAAYRSLLRRVRQQLHVRIAETIETLSPARVQAEVMARHYEAAGMTEAALAQYHRAGEHAAARSACQEAILHLRHALRLLESLPAGPEHSAREVALQLALGAPLVAIRGFPHPDTRAAYERALALCDASVATPVQHLAAALGGLSICTTSAGEFERGIGLAERLLSVRGEHGEDEHLLLAHLQIAIPRLLQARFTDAVAHCDRVLALYDPRRHTRNTIAAGVDHGVGGNIWSMWGLWFLGHPDAAVHRGDAAIALARAVDHPHSLAVALLWKTILHYWRREMDRTCDMAAETIALSEEQGFMHWVGVARAYRGAGLVAQGADAATLVDVVDGLTEAARAHQGGAPFLFGMLAEAHQAVGDFDQASAALEQGAAIAAMTAQPLWDPEFHRLKGELLLQQRADALVEAETLFRQALASAAAVGAQPLALRAATSLARLLQRRGQPASAIAALESVRRAFVEGHETPDLVEADALLEALRHA